MTRWGVAYERVTADSLVCRGPCLFYGAVILASAAGGDASLYDGEDADSGRHLITLKGDANISNPVIPPAPVALGEGLFAAIGENCDEVLVLYLPLGETPPEEEWKERYARGVAAARCPRMQSA